MSEQKSNKKKLIIIIISVILVVALGVGGFLFWYLNHDDGSDTVGIEADCGDVFQCLDALDPDSNLKNMNGIVGSEAEVLTDEDGNDFYRWTLVGGATIEARFENNDENDGANDGNEADGDKELDDGNIGTMTNATIKAEYPEKLVSYNADFSRWNEIKAKMSEKDGVTYDEFVEMIGDIDGAIKEKSPSSIEYQWFNGDGGYVSAVFDIKTNKCTYASGRI